MSYDFHLFIPKPGLDRQVALEAWKDEMESGQTNVAVPGSDKRKKSLVNALLSQSSNLESFELNFTNIAKDHEISEAEARTLYDHVEINDPKTGIQIMLFDNGASIGVPYGSTKIDSTSVIRHVWTYLQIFQREGGFLIFDPQVEQVLDLDNDLDMVTCAYNKCAEQINKAFRGMS